MKSRLVVVLVLGMGVLEGRGQDTTVAWINNVDSLAFKISYQKKDIPKELYKFLEIDSLNDIANPNEVYTRGCVRKNGVPNKQLHWFAKDAKRHWIISVAYGGLHHFTYYYFFDKEKGKLNIDELSFRDANSYKEENLTFYETIRRIKQRSFEFEEVDLTEYDDMQNEK